MTTKLERAYQTFLACHDVIRSSSNEQQMFEALCDTIVTKLGYRLAWIGLVEDEGFRVRPVAQAGYEEGYLSSILITWADENGGHGQGPTGRAIRSHRPSVCRDIRTDERFAPWREDALLRGYASSVALPFCDGARCLGAINIYAAEPDAFDDDELALLEEMLIDLQLGMQAHRMRTQLDALELQMDEIMRTEAAAAATVALGHDINNLLQAISTSVFLARRAPNSAMREEALDDAQAAADSIAGLIGKVLSLSRRAVMGGASSDPDRTLRAAEPMLSRLAGNASVRLELGAEGQRIAVSELDLERIVINLVINASHAMASGGCIRIATSLRTFDEAQNMPWGQFNAGHYLQLAVIDEGEGIAPDLMPRIFEPFFTTKTGTGTGLGLPSVLDIARQSGGGLLVRSVPGEGTEIDSLFPVQVNSPPDAPA